MSTSARVGTFRTRDGETLTLRDWPIETAGTSALIVHGLGEHGGRYERLAHWLNARNISARSFDQYGHGQSSGRRGHLARDMQLVEHLAELTETTRSETPNRRLLLIGHSLGGLLAASAVARGLIQPDALVLSSPALAVPMKAWQRMAVSVLPKWLPDLTLGNGLVPKFLSHDPAIVANYVSDPLVHDRICARLGGFVANEGLHVIEKAERWSVRTLLLYAGDDHLVDPRGSDTFTSRGSAAIRAQRFDALYHEIFNEQNSDEVFRVLGDWLGVAG